MTGDPNADRAIERVARVQHGAFSFEQAIHAGLTRKQIHHRVEACIWIRLAPGVFALASAPPTWRRQYKAAELTSPVATIAGLPAAHLHGTDGFRTVRPEIVVPYTSKTRTPIATVHRGHDVLTTVIDNIRVTTVAQTLFDLVPRITLDRLERAIDFHLLRKSVTVQNLIERRVSLDSSRRPGIAIWRALVDERSAHAWVPPESDLESDLWAVLRDLPGEPGLERQATMPWWQPGEGRVDVLAVNWRTIYEADGRAWHARVRDFDADRWRDNMAQANGYRVLRFTHTHLRQRPDEARTIAIQTGRWRVAAA